jgi:flagellar basal-body rod protein FlgB
MANQLSKFIFDKVAVPTFRKYLNLGSFRHKLVSGNLANLSTPGYKAREVDFQKEFARLTTGNGSLAGVTTNPNHIPLGQHEAKPPKVDELKIKDGDINSIDIDREASTMAENELLYTTAARLLQMRFDGLRKAITSE